MEKTTMQYNSQLKIDKDELLKKLEATSLKADDSSVDVIYLWTRCISTC